MNGQRNSRNAGGQATCRLLGTRHRNHPARHRQAPALPARRPAPPFAPAGIGLEIMDLQAACRTYNILAAEGRKVAAALLFD
jgi:uncharacterized protein